MSGRNRGVPPPEHRFRKGQSGNPKGRPRKAKECSPSAFEVILEKSLTVTIGDEGDGFDPTAVPDPLAGENLLRGSGRGVMLMQAFMDEFQISKRSPQGTEVKMVKYKAKAT